MEIDTAECRAETLHLPPDDPEIVNEERRTARLLDQHIRPAAADRQHAVLCLETGRDRSHRLAHASNSLLIASRSSLPLGLRGNSSRQTIWAGCMKLGSSRRR